MTWIATSKRKRLDEVNHISDASYVYVLNATPYRQSSGIVHMVPQLAVYDPVQFHNAFKRHSIKT